MKKIKLNKRTIFLIIYAIIILIILIYLLFIADDSFFIKNKKAPEINLNQEPSSNFEDYEEQIKKLQNNRYDYNYQIDYNSIQYRCQGTKNKEKEQGSCTETQKIEYTEKNKEEVYKKLNIAYLDVKNIFDLLKDTTPKENKYNKVRNYVYNITLDKLKTEVIVFTDEKNITKISIANGYETYILTYTNIKD